MAFELFELKWPSSCRNYTVNPLTKKREQKERRGRILTRAEQLLGKRTTTGHIDDDDDNNAIT